MKGKQEIINSVLKKVETQYKEDIAVLALYGSFAAGTADEYSDVDFFYIPKSDKAYELTYQFIIDGIGYDLFPITWDRILKIAAFDQPLSAVITESKVIYSATEEDLQRYESYRTNMLKLCTEEGAQIMLNKAHEYFNEIFIYCANMNRGELRLIDLRIEASKVISKLAMVVAYANHTFYKRGLGKNLHDSFLLSRLPKDYQFLVEKMIKANDKESLIGYTLELVDNTRSFLLDRKKDFAQPEPFESLFIGYYEELKSVINKMIRACDQEDQLTAYAVAAYFHEEISQFLTKVEVGIWYNDRHVYKEYSQVFERLFNIDLMDLVAEGNFKALKAAVVKFDLDFLKLLQRQDVDIVNFDSIESFISNYEAR